MKEEYNLEKHALEYGITRMQWESDDKLMERLLEFIKNTGKPKRNPINIFDGTTNCPICGHQLLEEEITCSMQYIEYSKRCPNCNLKIEEHIDKYEHEVNFINPGWAEEKIRERFLQLLPSLKEDK